MSCSGTLRSCVEYLLQSRGLDCRLMVAEKYVRGSSMSLIREQGAQEGQGGISPFRASSPRIVDVGELVFRAPCPGRVPDRPPTVREKQKAFERTRFWNARPTRTLNLVDASSGYFEAVIRFRVLWVRERIICGTKGRWHGSTCWSISALAVTENIRLLEKTDVSVSSARRWSLAYGPD